MASGIQSSTRTTELCYHNSYKQVLLRGTWGLFMYWEGQLTIYVPASVCLLDFTEIRAFASPSECKSATINDMNESLEVRFWLHWLWTHTYGL